MPRIPPLLEITPAGRILASLFDGPKGYTQLRAATGLSDRWLSKKLNELASAELIQQVEERYRVHDSAPILATDPIFAVFLQRRLALHVKARWIAQELGEEPGVVAVILFGSVAKQAASEESDIDLLVVTSEEMEDRLNRVLYDLMFKYDVPVEALFQVYDDFLLNLHAQTTFALGLLEGYTVLVDRAGVTALLALKHREVHERWIYDSEAGAWLPKKRVSISKPPKIS